MNIRESIYLKLVGLKGLPLAKYYRSFIEEEKSGASGAAPKKGLIKILEHCSQSVPYYARIMEKTNLSFYEDPFEYLTHLPILTKEIIRAHFDELKSKDLSNRKWFPYPSGGSTGKPVVIIRDRDFAARAEAIKIYFSKLAGREIGELEIKLWGSLRDIGEYKESLAAKVSNKLRNIEILNTFRMNGDQMRNYLDYLNKRKPKLIIAYVNSIFELARFAEQEKIKVFPQNAIITTAGNLYPQIRAMIETVFQCKVYNRYGSREVGDIACERPGLEGLWVAPWGNYIEIVDDNGNRVPDGQEGEILVTSLSNFAMPLIRYRIGDRGYLAERKTGNMFTSNQILGGIIGRTYEVFRTEDGSLINPGYFVTVLFNKDWINKYQVVQKSYAHIVFRLVTSDSNSNQAELDDITDKTRLVMGANCKVDFEFVDEIPENDSGKYRYLITEVLS